MNAQVIDQLININREFYQTFAKSFSATRHQIQVGVKKILSDIPQHGNWIDLGCGNGTLALEWAKQGRSGEYYGLDFSQDLLSEAHTALLTRTLPESLKILFFQADITQAGWQEKIPASDWNGVLAFAVLHHIPGQEVRMKILTSIHQILPLGGKFIFSVWQIQHSPRLMKRCMDWAQVGLSNQEVDAGDTLLDWRAELNGKSKSVGLRYVHIFTLEELQTLADQTGFTILDCFESDGKEGNLSLYEIWGKKLGAK